MKIVNNENVRFPLVLHNTTPGDCVEFERKFCPAHAADAKFLVLRVPTEYIVEKKRRKDGEYRVMVANLDTGYCSLVTNARRVRLVDAAVVLNP